jgi:hypothetical protein
MGWREASHTTWTPVVHSPAGTSGQRGVAVYPSLARLGVVAQTTGVQVEMAASRGWGIAENTEEVADRQDKERQPRRKLLRQGAGLCLVDTGGFPQAAVASDDAVECASAVATRSDGSG